MKMYLALICGSATLLALFLIFPHTLLIIFTIILAEIGLIYIHVEPLFLVINGAEFEIEGLKKTIKLAFISDLQIRNGKGKKWLKRLNKKILLLNPDIVTIGGDIISNESDGSTQEISWVEQFKQLTEKIPTFAVMGNHDYGMDYKRGMGSYQKYPDRHSELEIALQNCGVIILKNSFEELTINNQLLTIFGVDDNWAKKDNWERMTHAKHPVIALAHNPDSILKFPDSIKKPDLVLSGHTHGGQIRLPFIGPLGDARLKLGRKFYYGSKNYNSFNLFISRGLGESSFAMRFLCPPEIAVITLKPKV